MSVCAAHSALLVLTTFNKSEMSVCAAHSALLATTVEYTVSHSPLFDCIRFVSSGGENQSALLMFTFVKTLLKSFKFCLVSISISSGECRVPWSSSGSPKIKSPDIILRDP